MFGGITNIINAFNEFDICPDEGMISQHTEDSILPRFLSHKGSGFGTEKGVGG